MKLRTTRMRVQDNMKNYCLSFLCGIVFSSLMVSVSAHAQSVGALVELKDGARLYKTASTAGGDLSTTDNCDQLFMSVYFKGEYPYPFVQKVEKRQPGWIKIGPGWVLESNVEPLTETPISEAALNKQYMGMLFEDKSNSGMASTFLMRFSVRCDNGDMVIFMNNGDAKFIFLANRKPNLITCTKYLPMKNIEVGNQANFSVELHNERQGLKMYDLTYPKRLNTREKHLIFDEMMEIDVFDFTKITQADVKALQTLVGQYGRATTLCLSANTLNRLKVYEDK